MALPRAFFSVGKLGGSVSLWVRLSGLCKLLVEVRISFAPPLSLGSQRLLANIQIQIENFPRFRGVLMVGP